jgi:hypothetical protein
VLSLWPKCDCAHCKSGASPPAARLSTGGGSGPPHGDVAAHFRAPVPPADRNYASPMAYPPASPGRADAARNDRRQDRCDCRSGGATDGGDAAAALQPDAGHDTYRLSPPVLHHVGRSTGFGISRFGRGLNLRHISGAHWVMESAENPENSSLLKCPIVSR